MHSDVEWHMYVLTMLFSVVLCCQECIIYFWCICFQAVTNDCEVDTSFLKLGSSLYSACCTVKQVVQFILNLIRCHPGIPAACEWLCGWLSYLASVFACGWFQTAVIEKVVLLWLFTVERMLRRFDSIRWFCSNTFLMKLNWILQSCQNCRSKIRASIT